MRASLYAVLLGCTATCDALQATPGGAFANLRATSRRACVSASELQDGLMPVLSKSATLGLAAALVVQSSVDSASATPIEQVNVLPSGIVSTQLKEFASSLADGAVFAESNIFPKSELTISQMREQVMSRIDAANAVSPYALPTAAATLSVGLAAAVAASNQRSSVQEDAEPEWQLLASEAARGAAAPGPKARVATVMQAGMSTDTYTDRAGYTGSVQPTRTGAPSSAPSQWARNPNQWSQPPAWAAYQR